MEIANTVSVRKSNEYGSNCVCENLKMWGLFGVWLVNFVRIFNHDDGQWNSKYKYYFLINAMLLIHYELQLNSLYLIKSLHSDDQFRWNEMKSKRDQKKHNTQRNVEIKLNFSVELYDDDDIEPRKIVKILFLNPFLQSLIIKFRF